MTIDTSTEAREARNAYRQLKATDPTNALVVETEWAEAQAFVRREVTKLNEALGLTDAEHKVTFGYIGNGTLSSKGGWNLSGCLWSVYLPHPGRYGTREDQIGSVSDGDWQSLYALVGQVQGFRRGVEFAKSHSPASV